MILLAIAAQLSAPEALNTPWFIPSDVPIDDLTPDRLERVHFRLTVKPDGTLQACDVEASTGNRIVDRLTCRLLMKRARFNRAVSPNGDPIHGVYRAYTNWVMFSGPPAASVRPEGDLTLTVDRLPPGIDSPKSVRLQFHVDSVGKPSHCSAYEKEEVQPLVLLACEHFVKSYVASPARNEAGAAVPSMQTGLVVFKEQ